MENTLDENKNREEYRLTQYSRGAGCGCKIAPAVLEKILGEQKENIFPHLLVGLDTKDDAAVYDLQNGDVLIATTDFFMPIVDDAFDFGRIAAANAISDVYAMGGQPVLALAILGWPIETLPVDLAKQVIAGAREVCTEAGIPLAGGHSIDSNEPIFGLSVNGLAKKKHTRKNNTAHEGDLIFITKPIGTGILATALKRGAIEPAHQVTLTRHLTSLNKAGAMLGKIDGVHAMTDITGFGLAGHLMEMCEGSNLSATLQYEKVPLMPGVKQYLEKRIVPDATYRNWNSYSQKIAFGKGVNVMEAFSVLPDPQTNGGLLLAVSPADIETVGQILKENNCTIENPIGRFIPLQEKILEIH